MFNGEINKEIKRFRKFFWMTTSMDNPLSLFQDYIGDWAHIRFGTRIVDTHNTHDYDFFTAPWNGVYGFILQAGILAHFILVK